MNNKHTLVFSIIFAALLVSTPIISAQPNKPKPIPGQYIVVLSSDSDVQGQAEKAKARGEILHIYEHAIKGFALKVSSDKDLAEIKKNNPSILYIEPDYEVQASAQIIPSGIDRVDADASSAVSGDGQNLVDVDIAIIDTGIDLRHPDLNVYSQKSFVKGKKTANDDNGHGTHVAGIAAAKDNGIGVVGIAPGARLWAIKVLNSQGSGFMSDVIKGVDYVTANAASIEVANLSLGGPNSSALNDAIKRSVQAGVTYVVAAGNSAADASNTSPANSPDVIAVSAIVDTDGRCGGLGVSSSYGADDTFASFSNYGSVVDIAAPGVSIYSTYKNGAYATLSGTSMASPHVAGAAALFKSSNPNATPDDIKNSLLANGSVPSTICDGNGFGYFDGDKDAFAEPLLYVKNY